MGRLGWVDLETTGLDPQRDRILEVGCIVTEDNLTGVEGVVWQVYSEPAAEAAAADVVREMHAASGLWRASQLSRLDIEDVDTLLSDFLILHGVTGPLCGSSVHFDRAFMEAYLPKSLRVFSYRNIDVSSWKEVVKRLWPEREYRHEGEKRHRALEDLDASLQELNHYLDFMEER